MAYSPWDHKEPDLSTKQQHEMDNQQGPTVQHRESDQCYAEARMGGESGGELDTGIHMAESPRCSSEIITTL